MKNALVALAVQERNAMLDYKDLPKDMQNVSVIMNHLAYDMEHHRDKEPELLEKSKELRGAAAILLEWADKLQTQQEKESE